MFHALSNHGGSAFCNQQRFWPLRPPGKPLWEFKEHDHRLYCFRQPNQRAVTVVLFNGWIKQKKGKTKQEDREIERAQGYYAEFMHEYPGGNV